MDPITIMASVTAAFNGIKQAVHAGKEVQDIFKQLSNWADGAGQLTAYINLSKNKKPSIFESLKFGKSETSEAMDLIAAENRLREMEKEIRDMFYYGALQDMGVEGYRKFIHLRKEIRENRERMLKEQTARRKKFIINCFYGLLCFTAIAFLVNLCWIIYKMGVNAGKW